MITYKDEVLMHYGIKGQKKGRRRFQNPDGSLTAAGKLRYLDPSSKRNSGSYVRLKEEDKNSDAENGYLRTNSIFPSTGEPGAKSAFDYKPAHGSTVEGDSLVQVYSDSKKTYERYYNPDGSIEERAHSKDGKTTQIRKWKKDGTIVEDGTIVKDARYGKSPMLEYLNPSKTAVDAAVLAANLSATAQKQSASKSERYRKMTEQGQKQINAVKAKQEAEQKAAQEAEKYRKMTEYGDRQMNEAVAERHIWQNNAVHDLQERMLKANRATKSNEEVKLVQDNGAVYYMGIDRTGAPYFKNANHQPVYESEKQLLSRRYNLITDSRALAAKKANYSAKTMSKAEKEQQQKAADKFRQESAAKAKQRLTPEKADKVKKALAEKRTKKAVTKPNAKKNRREEIQ